MSFLQSIVCMKSASDYAASNCNTRTNVKICHFCVQNLKLHWLQKPAFCPAVDYVVCVSVFYVDTQKNLWNISRRYSIISLSRSFCEHIPILNYEFQIQLVFCWCKCLYERCYKPLQDPLQVTLISLFENLCESYHFWLHRYRSKCCKYPIHPK